MASQHSTSEHHIFKENAALRDILRESPEAVFVEPAYRSRSFAPGTETMTDPIRITRLQSRGSELLMFLSDREHPVRITEELRYKHRLKEGIVVTSPQLADLLAEAAAAVCESDALRFLSLREHSRGELKLKLLRKGHGATVIGILLARLQSRGLLDDAAYAGRVAQRLLERNPAGRVLLVAHLRRKQIERDLAEETVDQLLRDQDEAVLAVAALRKRWRHWRHLSLETVRTKAYTYLGRKGLSYEAAKAAVEQLASEDQDEHH